MGGSRAVDWSPGYGVSWLRRPGRLRRVWNVVLRAARSRALRAHALGVVLGGLAIWQASVDGAATGGFGHGSLHWSFACVMLGCTFLVEQIAGERYVRERLVSQYKADIESAADVCDAAARFLGDPHRASPGVEHARMSGARLRLLLDELEPGSLFTQSGGPR